MMHKLQISSVTVLKAWSLIGDVFPVFFLVGSWVIMISESSIMFSVNLFDVTHRAHDVVAKLNQRQWRWFNVSTRSCAIHVIYTSPPDLSHDNWFIDWTILWKGHTVYPIYSLVYPDKQHGRQGTHHCICGRGLEFLLVAIFLYLFKKTIFYLVVNFFPTFSTTFSRLSKCEWKWNICFIKNTASGSRPPPPPACSRQRGSLVWEQCVPSPGQVADHITQSYRRGFEHLAQSSQTGRPQIWNNLIAEGVGMSSTILPRSRVAVKSRHLTDDGLCGWQERGINPERQSWTTYCSWARVLVVTILWNSIALTSNVFT